MAPPGAAVAIPFSEIKRERVEWLLPGRIPLGAVTVLYGPMGLGKSMLACLIAAELSRGELGEPGVTLMATAEDSAAATIKPRLEAAEANLELIHVVQLRREGVDEGITIPDDVAELGRLVEETGARNVVIDPMSAHLPSTIDSYKDQSVRRALAPLARLAAEHECAVVAILHPNKSNGAVPLDRVAGSGAFPAAARSTLLFARDPDEEDQEHGARRVLAHVKCNLALEAESLLYEVRPIVLPATDEEPEVETARLELVGASNHKAADLFDAPNDEERSQIDEAEEFLLEALGPPGCGTWRLSSSVKAEAKEKRITPKPLRRARERLRVEIDSRGFPRQTYWRLRSGAPSGAPPQEGTTGTTGRDWA